MRRNLFIVFIFFLVSISCYAQIPNSFNYQTAIRSQDGAIIQNQLICLKTSIVDALNGNHVYAEKHQVATNYFGIVKLSIGSGQVVYGMFSELNWGAHKYFLKIELKIDDYDSFIVCGISEILSVPYVLYAANAMNVEDADANPENEIQTISISEDTISISLGNSIVLPYDADTSFTNEIQYLEIINDTIWISQGNYIVLPYDADTSSGNEIQFLDIDNNTIRISQGNEIVLPYDADTSSMNEIQYLEIIGDTIWTSQGNNIVLPYDADTSPTNEIQALSFSADTLFLENGGWVHLGSYMDNTDEQILSRTGKTLSISNGNSVTFNEAVDFDGDPTNELQFLSISNDTIYLSEGGYVVLPEAFDWQYSSLLNAPINVSYFVNDAGYINDANDDDFNPLNELQFISYSNDSVYISQGNSIVIPNISYNGIVQLNSNSSWVVPENIYSLNVIAIGAGASGSDYSSSSPYTWGGGAGGYVENTLIVSPGDTITASFTGGDTKVYHQNLLVLKATEGQNGIGRGQISLEVTSGGQGFSYVDGGLTATGDTGKKPYFFIESNKVYIYGGKGGQGFFNYGSGGNGGCSPFTSQSEDGASGTSGVVVIKW